MKRLTRLILWLYPAAWRERYHAELETLIEDSGSGWRVIFDLLKESVKLQLTTWSFGKLAAVLGLAGLIVAAVSSAFLPPVYVSQARMQIAPAPGFADENATQSVMQMENEILSRTSLSSIIQDPRLDLYATERESTPLEDVIDRMRTQDLQIRFDSPSTFTVIFHYPDKEKAHDTVKALITRFMDANLTRARVGVEYAGDALVVLDPPSVPVSPRIPFLPHDWEDLAKDLAPAWLRPDYVSQAELQMVPGTDAEDRGQLLEKIKRLQSEVLSGDSLSGIIRDPRLDLYASERKSKTMEDVIRKMNGDIRIGKSQSNPLAFTISFHYPDRRKTHDTVQALVVKFMDANRATGGGQLRFLPAPPPLLRRAGMNLSVLAAPSRPVKPTKPNRFEIAGLGLALGLMSAAIVKLLSKLRPATVA